MEKVKNSKQQAIALCSEAIDLSQQRRARVPESESGFQSDNGRWEESRVLALIMAKWKGTNGHCPDSVQAWRKNRTAREDLEHQSWTRGL